MTHYFEEEMITVSSEFTDVFTFDMEEGTDNVLQTPENVLIPLSLSRKFFNNESAVGKQLIGLMGNLTVGGVYRDFPSNTVVNNCIYLPISVNENKQDWDNWSYHVYIRVNDPANASTLCENFKQNFNASVLGGGFDWEEADVGLRLTALPEIHYITDVQYDAMPKASKQILMILLIIAITIIAIAIINFTNFSMALTPLRLKSINTQQVLGARRIFLRLALVCEAVVISFFSYLVALLLFTMFKGTALAELVDADLTVDSNLYIICGTAFVALFAGLFAGLYPSHFMTSFTPALVLKGSAGMLSKGKKMRNTLISIQFTVSFVLIICASFMYLQIYFMQNSYLGYEKDKLLTVNIEQIQKNRDAFTNQLKTYSGVDNVTYGRFLLSSSDKYMGWPREYNGKIILFQCLPVHYSFLQIMGIEITDGRDFRQEDAFTQQGAYVFNEKARNEYNLKLNTVIEGGGEIIGFMPDIKFASFRTTVEPMAFFVGGTENWGRQHNHAYIKLKAGTDMRASMLHIRNVLAEFNSESTFDVRYFDEILQQLYEKETSLSLLISLFSMIAIFISIVGVFGLVVFDSESRRKEIGIRKTLGASTTGIIIMFNKLYFKILLLCFIVAAPIAWYAVHHWLENFAYKTPMYWWVYLIAFIVTGIITATTVTFQNWRVANDNPVNAIKSE